MPSILTECGLGRKFSRSRRWATILSTAAVAVTSSIATSTPASAAILGTDFGLNETLNVPGLDISNVDLSAARKCVLGPQSISFSFQRQAFSTATSEAATVKGSSSCKDLTIAVSIVDHDVSGNSSDQSVQNSQHFNAKNGQISTSQVVDWFASNPVGLRPVSQVTITGSERTASLSLCQAWIVTVIAGGVAKESPTSC